MDVLHIMSSVDTGGIAMVVLNYYKNLMNRDIKFDIAITSDKIGQTGIEFENMGVSIFKGIPLKSVNLKGYKKSIEDILENKHYDAIHVHENETSYIALSVAKKMGIPIRIAHSHTSSPYINIKSEIRRLSGIVFNNYYSTNLLSCSNESADRVFGGKTNKLTVLPNAIDTSKFRLNYNVREEYRINLNLRDKYVLGMVGRLDEEKNYEFVLNILGEIIKEDPKCILVIVGEGPLNQKLRNLISLNALDDHVLLLGSRTDVSCLMQAFDIFILPSIHEGFPVVVVEAIVSGLPIVLSNSITDEVNISKDINFISLSDPKQKWVKTILSYKDDLNRNARSIQDKPLWVDIKESVKILENIYIKKIL